jgi:hypothetical protein
MLSIKLNISKLYYKYYHLYCIIKKVYLFLIFKVTLLTISNTNYNTVTIYNIKIYKITYKYITMGNNYTAQNQ